MSIVYPFILDCVSACIKECNKLLSGIIVLFGCYRFCGSNNEFHNSIRYYVSIISYGYHFFISTGRKPVSAAMSRSATPG